MLLLLDLCIRSLVLKFYQQYTLGVVLQRLAQCSETHKHKGVVSAIETQPQQPLIVTSHTDTPVTSTQTRFAWSCGEDGSIRQWFLPTPATPSQQQTILPLALSQQIQLGTPLTTIAIAFKGNLVASGDWLGNVYIVSDDLQTVMTKVSLCNDWVASMIFVDDSSSVLVASEDGKAVVYSIAQRTTMIQYSVLPQPHGVIGDTGVTETQTIGRQPSCMVGVMNRAKKNTHAVKAFGVDVNGQCHLWEDTMTNETRMTGSAPRCSNLIRTLECHNTGAARGGGQGGGGGGRVTVVAQENTPATAESTVFYVGTNNGTIKTMVFTSKDGTDTRNMMQPNKNDGGKDEVHPETVPTADVSVEQRGQFTCRGACTAISAHKGMVAAGDSLGFLYVLSELRQ